MVDQESRQCPFCREEINSEATKCKHCGSRIEPARPDHGGECPYCKEQIDPEAVICKHCRSNVRCKDAGGCLDCADSMTGSMALRTAVGGFRPGGLGVDGGGCTSWCAGSTLWCACPVRIPGIGMGTVIYPCGTCSEPVITA